MANNTAFCIEFQSVPFDQLSQRIQHSHPFQWLLGSTFLAFCFSLGLVQRLELPIGE